MKILITGASGLLGSSIATELNKDNDLILFYNEHPIFLDNAVSRKVSLEDWTALNEAITQYKPNLIVHCAAVTNVDLCETHKEVAYKINYESTKYLADLSDGIGAKLVYISTDSVFDGEKGMYTEQDQPNPLNYYAETKLMGEDYIRENISDYIIFRTNIYGNNFQHKQSLAEWVLNNAITKREVNLFNDVYFNPMHTRDFGWIIKSSIDMGIKGTYHLGCKESISKLEFGKRLIDKYGLKDIKINEISVADIKFTAQRPKNTTLITTKIEDAVSKEMPHLDHGISEFIDSFRQKES